VVEVDGRQILYLLLGDAKADLRSKVHHGADGDCHFFAAPQMPFLEQNVSDVMVAGVDDEPLDFSNLTIRGVYWDAPSNCHFPQWQLVVRDR
jgi:hypothetical protein